MPLNWRPLGATYHTAQHVHECDRCMHHILPGDRYKRCVEIRNSKLLVWRYHDNPDCPPDPFDFDRMEESETPFAHNDNIKGEKTERAA